MNNSELDARLKAAREPALPTEYTAAFPQTVLTNLRSSSWKRGSTRRSLLPRLTWGLGTVACVLLAFTLGHWRGHVEKNSGQDVLANAKLIQGTLAMFPNQVRAIVRDTQGLKLVLTDGPEVPASNPIYVRISNGNISFSLVTFSGQEIQIAGQKLTVLSQPDGGIILEGDKFVWSSRETVYAGKKLGIEARNLDLTTM